MTAVMTEGPGGSAHGPAGGFEVHLDKIAVSTLVLMAALPVAGTVFLFAERQGANSERVAAAILVTTALSFFSFSALCWAFGIQVG